MNWEAIQAAARVQPGGSTGAITEVRVPTAEPGGVGHFGQMFSAALEEVNGKLLTSQTDLQHMAVGDVQNLHQIIIRLEESRLSFQLLMQVRNRLLEAYQDVMKMQV